MGAHWVDPTAPEFSGSPFAHSFIYGTYDAKVVFIEPMVSLAFLKTKQSLNLAIPQPTEWQKKGILRPTRYTVTFDPVRKEYSVAFEAFVKR